MATGTPVGLLEVPGKFEKYCEPCEQDNEQKGASVVCKQCNEFQCKECVKVHDKFAFMKDHEIVPASDDSVSGTKSKVDMKGLDQCKDHRKIFEFYCVDHKQLCCSGCAIGHLRKCNKVISIEKHVGSVKPDTTESTVKLTNIKTDSQELKDSLFRVKSDIRKQIGELPVKIDAMRVEVNKAFDELQTSVMERSNSFDSDISEQLGDQCKICDKVGSRIDELLVTLQAVSDHGSPVEIYIANENIQFEIEKQVVDLQRAGYVKDGVNLSVDFDPTLTSMLQEGCMLGSLVIDKIVCDIGVKDMKPVTLVLTTSVDVKQTGDDKKEPLYTGLEFLPDDRLVVVDNKNCKLYVMNERLEKLGEYRFDSKPLGVAVVSADEVAVTRGTGYKLLILNISKTNTISLTKTIRVTSEYYSICPMNDATYVVSTSDDKRPVRMITVDGKESNIPGIPEKQYKFDAIACTYIRKTDTLVFMDIYEHAVYMYDMKGKYVTLRVVRDKNIRKPMGACEGPDGTVLVCSSDMNMIVQLSPAGKVIGTFKLDMMHPREACMSQDGTKLAVINTRTGAMKLQMFSLQ